MWERNKLPPLFFLNIFYWLCYYSCPRFPTLPPSAWYRPSLQHSAPLSSCPWITRISSLASPFPILFLTSPCLFCVYQLCFLIPAPFPPVLPVCLQVGNLPNDLYVYDSVPGLVVCLVCVLHSKLLKDTGFFCHFIVHSFKKIILLLLSYSCLHLPLTI